MQTFINRGFHISPSSTLKLITFYDNIYLFYIVNDNRKEFFSIYKESNRVTNATTTITTKATDTKSNITTKTIIVLSIYYLLCITPLIKLKTFLQLDIQAKKEVCLPLLFIFAYILLPLIRPFFQLDIACQYIEFVNDSVNSLQMKYIARIKP
jgi:hypothetical protein